MSHYSAPLRDMHFVLRELAGIEQVGKLPGYEEATPDTVDAIIEEAAKFASGVLAPLNAPGDQQGAVWRDSGVTMPAGFLEAYGQFIENGWNGIGAEPEYGGQGMPYTVVAAVNEMWKASNMAFSLCPLLTTGAIEAITLRGSPEQKAAYLPKMIEGSWTGTMNLTEPQAGSDLGLMRARAVPAGRRHLQGLRPEDLHHLRRARHDGKHHPPGAGPHAGCAGGVKGISLFVVPKFLVNPTARRAPATTCAASPSSTSWASTPARPACWPTATTAAPRLPRRQGERGPQYMFVMMNAARFAVGLEGWRSPSAPTSRRCSYARRPRAGHATWRTPRPGAIIRHPDVRRMLMTMRARPRRCAPLAYVVGGRPRCRPTPSGCRTSARQPGLRRLHDPHRQGLVHRSRHRGRLLGIQVHGGMGFIEETGAAQHLRDARITTIYEGTTGIQANDLVGPQDRRATAAATIKSVIAAMQQTAAQLGQAQGEDFAAIQAGFARGLQAFTDAALYIGGNVQKDIKGVFAGAVPFLKLAGIVCGGWQMARAALVAQEMLAAGGGDAGFYKAKIATARFFAEHLLSQAPGLAATMIKGGASTLAVPEEFL
jgi:alkylation response protein AidB-like acyl-CoA dehydrogenase